jgi:hypothetical protein
MGKMHGCSRLDRASRWTATTWVASVAAARSVPSTSVSSAPTNRFGHTPRWLSELPWIDVTRS